MKIAWRTLLVMLLITILIIPAVMSMQLVSASSPDHPLDGAVSGRVTTQDTNVGLPHARVAIVNAASGQEIYIGASDQMGFYQFPGVTNTWDSSSGQYLNSYKIHVTHSLMGDGYSGLFAVEERSTAPANVIIYSDIKIVTATPTATPTIAASPTASAAPSASPMPSASTSPTPTPPADHSGAVCGRVTVGDSSTGVPNAYVAIVMASDPGQKLYAGTTDSSGFYQFAQVQDTWNSATGCYEDKYKLYAKDAMTGEAYSNAFAVEARSVAPANICIVPATTPSTSSTPVPTTVPDHTGAVSGRVTAEDSTTGVPNTYVAIVLASDPNQRLYVGSTDSNGFYQFFPVQDTWNSATGACELRYKVYARHSRLGEGYSVAFAVETRSVASANIRIAPIPTPVATATPMPTPRYSDLINATPNSSVLNVTGNMVYAPEGTSLDSVVRDGRIAVRSGENDTGSIMVLRITPLNNTTATISDASLVAQKEATLNGRNVTVYASADLNGVPANATLGLNITAPEDADGRISEALGRVGLNNSSKVLAVVEVIKGNLKNGRDIKSGSLTITMPRPADFDPSGSYKVVRESDGQYSLLDARLISSPDADTLTFEVITPGGFSTFTLVAVAAPASTATAGTTTQPGAEAEVDGSLLNTILIDVLLVVMLVALLGIVIYWQVFRSR